MAISEDVKSVASDVKRLHSMMGTVATDINVVKKTVGDLKAANDETATWRELIELRLTELAQLVKLVERSTASPLSPKLMAKLKKAIIMGSDGVFTNGYTNYGLLFVTGLKADDNVDSVIQEILRCAKLIGLNGMRIEVEVFALANGKKVAKMHGLPQACSKLLRAWPRLYREDWQKGAAGPVPAPYLNLNWDLTKDGQAERKRLKPIYDRLKAAGKFPSWNEGVELLYRPDGNPKSKPMPYAEEEAGVQQDADMEDGTCATPAKNAPRDKRGPDMTGTALKVNISGEEDRNRAKKDVGKNDQGGGSSSSSVKGA